MNLIETRVSPVTIGADARFNEVLGVLIHLTEVLKICVHKVCLSIHLPFIIEMKMKKLIVSLIEYTALMFRGFRLRVRVSRFGWRFDLRHGLRTVEK